MKGLFFWAQGWRITFSDAGYGLKMSRIRPDNERPRPFPLFCNAWARVVSKSFVVYDQPLLISVSVNPELFKRPPSLHSFVG